MKSSVLREFINERSPFELLKLSGFDRSIKIVCEFINDDEWDEFLHQYAVELLEEIRKNFPDKWNTNWRHDALLGLAYDITLKYDNRFDAYKRAYNNVDPKPPELLVALAGCCWAPGKPPLSEEESIALVKEAIKTTPYIEAVELLRGLYKSLGNIKEQKLCEEILEKVKDSGVHLPSLDRFPDFDNHNHEPN